MSQEFSGKVVLITGASSGIGAGTAKYFSNLGASLALTGRNLENLQKVATQCSKTGNKPLLIQADLTKVNDQTKIITSTIEKFGKLDVLVNNAGIFETGTLEDVNISQLDKMLDTNVRAVFQLTKLAIPHLKSTKGSVINVSSVLGLRPVPGYTSYGMAKAALNQFTQCLALELAPDKVRVNSVAPGVIETDLFKTTGMKEEDVPLFLEREGKNHPLGRVGQVEDVAGAIAYLASGKASFITGVLLPVDGGRTIAAPL